MTKGRENGQGTAAIFRAFLMLGLTSFGGPVAHLSYFRTEFVTRRRWLGDADYADVVALAQFLPGPASSQVGFALGLRHGGWRGGLAAWAGFTLPSALALMLFGLGAAALTGPFAQGVIAGLKVLAVAVVGHALVGMARSLCPDPPRMTLALAALVALLLWQGPLAQVAVILAGGALAGVNAAVVGVLGAAFCSPVLVTGIGDGLDLALAASAFVALTLWKAPVWVVVIATALAGGTRALLGV